MRGLIALHVYQSQHSARQLMPLSPEAAVALPPAAHHLLVRRHPLTGRAALYINPSGRNSNTAIAGSRAIW